MKTPRLPQRTISGPTSRPICPLSTLRDHGRPCTSYGHARLASDVAASVVVGGTLTPGRSLKFQGRYLLPLQPGLPGALHFSGHGSQDHVDSETGGAGIHLQDERQHVSERALAQMIASAAPSTRVVVLNACFSDALAESLRHLVDCVVGMNGAISDDAARSFAVGFYRALGNWRSIGNAIAQAIATLAAKRLPAEHIPVCRTRKGVNADRLFLPRSC